MFLMLINIINIISVAIMRMMQAMCKCVLEKLVNANVFNAHDNDENGAINV